MEFCKFCDNMLYIKHTNDEDIADVHYFCKFCGNKEDFEASVPKLISKNSFKNDDSIDKWVKKDIEHDVTLPHVNNINCVNKDCGKKPGEDNDIILLRYNNVDVKFIYYCVHCKNYWNNE